MLSVAAVIRWYLQLTVAIWSPEYRSSKPVSEKYSVI